MLLAFIESESFPVMDSTDESSNSSEILLKRFKEWLADGCESDVAFKHRATAFLLYGPLQDLYNAATAHGDGIVRETVYHLPLYMHSWVSEITIPKFSGTSLIFWLSGQKQPV